MPIKKSQMPLTIDTMIKMLRAIEDSYIETFPKIVADERQEREEEQEEMEHYEEIIDHYNMNWDRIGMLLELGYIDHNFMENNKHVYLVYDDQEQDPEKYMKKVIQAARDCLSDEKVKNILTEHKDELFNGKSLELRFTRKAFKAAFANKTLSRELERLIKE